MELAARGGVASSGTHIQPYGSVGVLGIGRLGSWPIVTVFECSRLLKPRMAVIKVITMSRPIQTPVGTPIQLSLTQACGSDFSVFQRRSHFLAAVGYHSEDHDDSDSDPDPAQCVFHQVFLHLQVLLDRPVEYAWLYINTISIFRK